MKKLVAFALALMVIISMSLSAAALDYGFEVDTVSSGIYLEEMGSGKVVYEKNADSVMYPASTTKIMTYIVVSENVADFDETMVEITDDALYSLDPESSVMGLTSHIGESFSVRDLLYGLLLPSGNDAALVLADYVGGGSIDNFVEKMNRKAEELGCEHTHFANPHGLTDPNHYTTPREMATIAKFAMNQRDFMEIANTTRYTPAGFDNPLVTTNYMIDEYARTDRYYYPYAKGIKTGFTDEAGRCLVSTAETGGYTYLCVAFGAAYSYEEDINYAMLDSIALYDWAFDHLAFQTVFTPDDVITNIGVKGAKTGTTLDLSPSSEIAALLPSDYDREKVSTSFDCPDSVTAPVSKGMAVGTVSVYYDGELIATGELCASADIAKTENEESTDTIRWILIVVFVVAGVIVLFIILVAASNARRRKKEEMRRRRRMR